MAWRLLDSLIFITIDVTNITVVLNFVVIPFEEQGIYVQLRAENGKCCGLQLHPLISNPHPAIPIDTMG